MAISIGSRFQRASRALRAVLRKGQRRNGIALRDRVNRRKHDNAVRRHGSLYYLTPDEARQQDHPIPNRAAFLA